MYTQFYGFSEKPFDVTPDPRFLFLTESHQEALSSMIYGIRERRGFISISGEVGTGKTTLIYSLLGRLDESVKTVHIFHTKATFEELLKNILLELEVPNIQEGKTNLLCQLNEYLIQKLAHGENLAVIIDEAQNLSPEVLEELRMLSNLETPKTKLLQIVLVGQPELETKLNSEELRQLKQRIGIRRRISRLNEEESREYIDHRLKLVGRRSSAVFTPEALSQICQYAGGIPRIINILCDSGFLIGYGLSKKRIDASIIQEVMRDMEGSTWANSTPPEPAAVPSPAPSSTPPTVDRGLSAAFQPSTVDRRLWTILFKPLTVDRRLWTILFKPLTVDRWPHMIFSRVSLLALLFVCLSLVAYVNREYLKVASAPPQPKPSIHQPVLPRPYVAPAPGIKAVSSASVLPTPTPTASNRGPSSITGASSVDRGQSSDRGPSTVDRGRPSSDPGLSSGRGLSTVNRGRLLPRRLSSSNRTVSVQRGYSLSSLARKYYGLANTTLVDHILEANPSIANPHLLQINQQIQLPELTESLLIVQSSDGTCRVHLGTFAEPESARAYRDEPALQGKEIEVIRREVSPRETWHRVLAGHFENEEQCLQLIRALKQKGLLPTFGGSPTI